MAVDKTIKLGLDAKDVIQKLDKIEKELGGKANGHEDYLEGKGTQFSFDLNGKSYSVDLWDEDILNDV